MSQTFQRVVDLVNSGHVRISEHGYDELSSDNLWVNDLIAGVRNGKVVEDYPNFPKGPCVLVLQTDSQEMPVHVVWGIPRLLEGPAVLITAYRPDSDRWDETYTRRKQ